MLNDEPSGTKVGMNGWIMKTNPNCIPDSGAGPT
jgi:hypothetical protein